MEFRVTLDGRLTSASGKLDDAVREAMNTAMGELFVLETADPAIDLDFAAGDDDGGDVTISCRVVVDSVEDAVPPASSNIRAALHAAGIGTPDWPKSESPAWTVNFIGSRSEALV